MSRRALYFLAAAFIFSITHAVIAADTVKITQLDDKLRVEISGKLFTEYYFTNVPRPFCYPLIGPGELPMTRNWPMKETPGEEQDHPHHKSLWFAHGDVNGIDFWSEQKAFGKQVHEKFLELKSGKTGVIKSANKWVSADGKIICRDERTLTFFNSSNPRMLDFEITIKASEGDLIFGDTKEGTMAIRVAESMRVFGKDKPSEGRIVMSTGVVDDGKSAAAARSEKHEDNTWGKRAEWCDYSGPVNGKIVGIAIFDSPKNPRHPTWWHVRDYGLFAANPFGVHHFEKKPDHEGDLKVPAGQSITFRYRIVLHESDEKTANIAKLYEKFSKK